MFGSQNGVTYMILGSLFSLIWAFFKAFLVFCVEMKSGFSLAFLQAHAWDLFMIANSLSLAYLLRHCALKTLEARGVKLAWSPKEV